MVAKGMAGNRPRRSRTVIVTRVGWSRDVASLAAARRILLVRIPPEYVHRSNEDHQGAPFHADPRAVKLLIEVFPDPEAQGAMSPW